MEADDIFCGDCGHVSRSVSDTFSRPRDTVVIDRITAGEMREMTDVPHAPDAPEPPAQAVAPPARPEHDPIDAPTPAADTPATVEPAPTAARLPENTPLADSGDLEATRIVRRESGARFVLQFSTGESFTVYGTGLIGRNPRPEPGEYVDQLVRVLDASRSVSKTHLEFGQEDGAFWVADRFSGNGTVVREPDSPPVRCQPDKRHRIMRGTRVEIGEQFFIVS
jgi:hypothetical protein